MKKFLLEGRTLPRWIIFFVDLIIISWSFSFSYFLVQRFDFSDIVREQYLIYVSLFCLIASAVIYLLRLHTGLLRYSNTHDMLRIFGSVFIFSAVFLGASFLIIKPVFHLAAVPLFSILIINFFITSSILIMLRIFAKATFNIMIKRYSKKKVCRVLIYGSDKNAVLVKQALQNNSDIHYIIEGFLDFDHTKLNNSMEQKKVYHLNELSSLNSRKRINQIIIVNELLGERDKKVVIERALRLGIKVVTIPPAAMWISGKLDTNQIQKLSIVDLLQRKPIQIDQSLVRKDLRGKRVLVTGAAGSIGSEIVRQVLKYDPALLILCDQAESPLHEMQLELEERFPNASISIEISDVRNYNRMHMLFETFLPQVVYHAAAYKHVPLMEKNPCEAVKSNVLGTKNVADLAVKFGTNKFVMISTDKAVNPTNIMGATKRLAEIYVQSLNNGQRSLSRTKTRFITTRFGNVLGSNGSVIPRFKDQIEKGGPVTVTHPEITRFFMTIPEAVQLVLEAGTLGDGGEIFVFDMGKPVKILDLAKKMIQLAGLKEGKDIDILFTGLRPGEKLYEELLNDTELSMPTHNDKINIAKVVSYPFEETKRNIDELLAINEELDDEIIVRRMKQLVPEFVSKNSPFELIDSQLEEKQETA